jgi:hypothetical protein
MEIRSELHPIVHGNGKFMLPAASYNRQKRKGMCAYAYVV